MTSRTPTRLDNRRRRLFTRNSISQCTASSAPRITIATTSVSLRGTTRAVAYFDCPVRAGSGVVRIDPLSLLVGCRKRRLNQALSVLSLSTVVLSVLLFIRAPFCVALVCLCVCSVCWLFWLSRQYLPNDWLERFL